MPAPTPRRLNKKDLSGLLVPRYESGVPGLPPYAVTFSNSERTSIYCPFRHRAGYGMGWTQPTTSAMDFGTSYHAVQENIHRFWMEHPDASYADGFLETCWRCTLAGHFDPDCSICEGTGNGPLPRAMAGWTAQQAAGQWWDEDEETPEQRLERLTRMSHGYFEVYGREAHMRSVGVEVPMCRPIQTVDGRPYAPELFLFEFTPGKFRFARPQDDEAYVWRARLPWYYICRLDGLMMDDAAGLWVEEHKTSKQPKQLERGLSVDPQTTGYVWALAHAAREGHVPLPATVSGARPTASGYRFNIAFSSMQRDPEELKTGGLSQRTDRLIPSWRYRAAVQRRGEDEEKYAAHIVYLTQHVDERMYQWHWSSVGTDERRRFGYEILGVARRLVQARRDVWLSKTQAQVAEAFPRLPYCKQMGGQCPYRGPCVGDNPFDGSAYQETLGQTWSA